jgi:protein-S-isoprenylcysteine O-methyltransferase Ste14
LISLISIALILVGSLLFSMLYMVSLQPKSLSLRLGPRAYRCCGIIRYAAMLFEMMTVGGYILFTFGTAFNYRLTGGNSLPIRLAGAAVTLAALSFMAYAMAHAGGESAVPSSDTTLHHGIYDFMRHPQTLGEMLSWFGISMVLNSLTLLVYSVIWVPVFMGFTIVEDNDLSVRFGEEFIRYAERVGPFWRKARHT